MIPLPSLQVFFGGVGDSASFLYHLLSFLLPDGVAPPMVIRREAVQASLLGIFFPGSGFVRETPVSLSATPPALRPHPPMS